uniref:AAA+ ATPase domain-containing protein n=1 Tax=Glycine max TaxID=3847 RepID=A0A0R0ES83_SOYBN
MASAMLVGVYDHRRRRQRLRASRMLENGIRILKEEVQRSNREWESYKEKIKNNEEKVKLHKQLPYLVANIVEILDMNPEDEAEEDGANIDLDSQRKGKCVVLKTSTRQTIFLLVVGLVDPDKLKPGYLAGAMEVDEKPTEDYNDIGGLEKQIQEWVETIVLPITHKERFQKFGVGPPKGVLLYGPPGTGKTLIARACAAQTNATFLKLAAKLVRDAFQLAKEKSPCIIFMDEIDAIGTKRFDSEVSGDRELQRTMLELLNQLDGFSSDDRVKIHSRKMNVHPDVNAAQLKAVCVEAGMLALCRDATEVNHEDFDEGIIQVQAKKKASLDYYA